MLHVIALIDVLLRLLLMEGELGLQVIDAEELRLERLREDYDEFAIVSLILGDRHSDELLVAHVRPALLLFDVLRHSDLEIADAFSVEKV